MADSELERGEGSTGEGMNGGEEARRAHREPVDVDGERQRSPASLCELTPRYGVVTLAGVAEACFPHCFPCVDNTCRSMCISGVSA